MKKLILVPAAVILVVLALTAHANEIRPCLKLDAYGYFTKDNLECSWYALRSQCRGLMYLDWRVTIRKGGESGEILKGDHGYLFTEDQVWLNKISIPKPSIFGADYVSIQLWGVDFPCGSIVFDRYEIKE
jgi:hypothetical protein